MTAEDPNAAGSGSYVLGAMDATERDEFETQLADSEELRNEVTELTDTAVLLGLAVPEVMPSPALKQNIMARLNQIPQLAPDEEAPARRLQAVPALADETVSVSSVREPNAKAQARWYSRPLFGVVAAAAAVLVVAGAVVGSNLIVQNSTTTQQASALASIETASDVQRAEASVSNGGKVTLVWSLHQGKSAILRNGLATLPGDKTYELWYIDGAGKATPAGTFESTGKDGYTVLSGHMSKGDTVGITVEPAGGSKAPTTKPVVAIASA